jgi:hypothetical protein
MNYMFKRWGSFTRFLDDGRVCLSNNAAERALRGIALGRKSWLTTRIYCILMWILTWLLLCKSLCHHGQSHR